MTKDKKNFNHNAYAWKANINYRENPLLYKVGKGEQGVLICEPYKSEILPLWKFKTPIIAKNSATAIYKLFLNYIKKNDFVGADMARKYLQMGYTRSRRYFNYRSGRKYDVDHKPLAYGTGEAKKAESAMFFYKKWRLAEANQLYSIAKKRWKDRLG